MSKYIFDVLTMILKLSQYVALLLVVFHILFRSGFFYKLNIDTKEKARVKMVLRQILLIISFGLASIIATESAIEMYGAYANTRDLAPIIAGILGGPLAGIGAGLIGALYRFSLGGFTCIACSIATVLAGVAGGIFYLFRKGKFITPVCAIFFGILYEVFHLGLVVLISRPVEKAITAVLNLGIPMILVNAIGLFLFSFLVKQYEKHIEDMATQEKVENELEVVHSLQTSILPAISSDVKLNIETVPSIDKLIPHMKRESFKEGEIIFRKDDTADKLFYIISGLLELIEINKIVGEGNVIGETGIFSPFHKRTMSVRCYSDLEVYSIHQKDMMKLLYEIPALFFDLIQLTIRRFTVNMKKTIAEREKIESELKIATAIQKSMLSNNFFPERKDIDIYATMTPAREVGGDFYDFFFIDKNKLFFTIADVSGKGIPAALFMVITKTLLKTEALRCVSPNEILTRVNNILFPDNEECMFVTTFCGILDTQTGTLEYSNAGHNPPLLYRKNNNFDFIKVNSGFVLAGMDNFKYTKQKIKMESGDIFFLYTDGVTEAMNKENQQFSNKRLKDALSDIEEKKVKKIISDVHKKVKSFTGKAPQSDDITMLALKYNG